MRVSKKSQRTLLSFVLIAALMVSVIACTLVVHAQPSTELASTGADNYYLWGINSNDPDFGAMHSPTGSFSYDGTKGYYYYDLNGASGDYCFVVSRSNDSGANAVKAPAVGNVQNSGKYYLSQGNYHGYACMHIWNPAGEAVRIYFTSESAGLNCIAQSEAGSVTPTPTTAGPTTSSPTTAPPVTGGYVYLKNNAGWQNCYAYMWTTGAADQNASWPGAEMESIGNNVWRYKVTGSYANIIFNGGGDSTKTDDMAFPGTGKIYDNKSGSWSNYGGSSDPTTSNPTTSNPTTSNPTSPPPTTNPSGKQIVYCENEAGWGMVNVYMWNSGTDSNAGWPGANMTKIGGNIWSYTLPKSFKNIIFNGGSDSNKTNDMEFPGSGYIYNNKTGKWSIYDTSPLQVQSFGTDVEAPQYAGVGITLTASATGEGTVYYKFSVNSTVIKDYGTANKALWTPTAAGTYTLTYEFKDSKGNTNKRTKSYQITDGASLSSPFIKTVTPANGQQIKKSATCSIKVTAGGGNTGTKLLFYKYTVKDASGNIVNVPYYTKNSSYSFTPSALGRYTLTVSVQASDNTLAERDYIYDSVTNPSNPSDETAPAVTPTQGGTQSQQPTSTSGGATLVGDSDGDGQVTILDATRVQRWLADLVTDKEINKKNADVDFDNTVTILDATRIQRFIAGLISKFS